MRARITAYGREGAKQAVKIRLFLPHRLSRYDICSQTLDNPSRTVGTESMTFPVTVGPGETGFLANPDPQQYLFWQGTKTLGATAQ